MTFVLYYAASVDGFIGDSDGGVSWLDAFNTQDYGYESFVAQLDSVVMGRRTYEQSRSFGGAPYAGKRVFVLSSTAVQGGDAEVYDTIDAILERVREADLQRTWVVGGAMTMAAFVDRGLIDRITHFVIPVTLGSGVPIFTGSSGRHPWALAGTQAYTNGVVQLSYVRETEA